MKTIPKFINSMASDIAPKALDRALLLSVLQIIGEDVFKQNLELVLDETMSSNEELVRTSCYDEFTPEYLMERLREKTEAHIKEILDTL